MKDNVFKFKQRFWKLYKAVKAGKKGFVPATQSYGRYQIVEDFKFLKDNVRWYE